MLWTAGNEVLLWAADKKDVLWAADKEDVLWAADKEDVLWTADLGDAGEPERRWVPVLLSLHTTRKHHTYWTMPSLTHFDLPVQTPGHVPRCAVASTVALGSLRSTHMWNTCTITQQHTTRMPTGRGEGRGHSLVCRHVCLRTTCAEVSCSHHLRSF